MHALLRVSVRAMRPGIFRAPHQPLAPRRFEDIAIRCHPNAIANSRQTDAFIQLGFCYCTYLSINGVELLILGVFAALY